MAWRNLIVGHLRINSTELFENQPDTFGGEDFLSFHYSHIRQNSPSHLAAMFFNHSTWLEGIWYRVIQGTIPQNYLKICQPVLEKNNFEVFFVSLPWKPEFCMDPKNLKEFWLGHREDAFCEVLFQLTHWLLRRRCWHTTDISSKRRSQELTLSTSCSGELKTHTRDLLQMSQILSSRVKRTA